MARVKAPANLPDLVKTVFNKAKADGEVHFFPTQATLLPIGSVPFQLRFSPALANKPKGPPPEPSAGAARKPVDPFANPPASLYVSDLGPSHYLVLNKFAVVHEHFILATKEFKEQTHVLEEADLESTLSCIEAYENARDPTRTEDDGLFAFFNCGEHSGASQPHRHIQLLPVDRMRDGLESGARWNVLADRDDLSSTPFVVFSERIHLGMPSSELYSVYLRLYRRACKAMDAFVGHTSSSDSAEVAPSYGPTRISYNMAMTKSNLLICPRLAEGDAVTSGGNNVGKLALNGTLLAGTALVKNEAEWDALRKNPDKLAAILKAIGLPRDKINDSMLRL